MKRVGNLYDDLCEWRNLWDAALKARKGKRFRPNVAAFEFCREQELLSLQSALRSESYRPGRYRSFWIHEPKHRLISAAPYRDRVVHHAICRLIEPVWEAVFITDSYACRVGKGSLAAMKRAHEFCRRFKYLLKCDIQRFFPSIDHQILLTQLERKLKDRRLLSLLEVILKHPFPGQTAGSRFPGDDLFTPLERSCGLPIGNQTSQFFGNVMLNPLDHFIKEDLRIKGYVRYADDFLLFSDDRPLLARIRDQLREFLEPFRLRIHPHKSIVFPTRCGLPFLGYRLLPDRIRLGRKHLLNLRRRLHEFERQCRKGMISVEEAKASLQSWWGYAMHADCQTIVQSILSDFPFLETKDENAEKEKKIRRRFAT
jgi:retron-type reverse transcriptase